MGFKFHRGGRAFNTGFATPGGEATPETLARFRSANTANDRTTLDYHPATGAPMVTSFQASMRPYGLGEDRHADAAGNRAYQEIIHGRARDGHGRGDARRHGPRRRAHGRDDGGATGDRNALHGDRGRHHAKNQGQCRVWR